MDDIAACLAPDGWLLVLEDQRMNVGELPHDKGLLVLDGVELQELFGVPDREPDALRFTVDDRLSLAQISRAVLRNCDGPRVQAAVCWLHLHRRARPGSVPGHLDHVDRGRTIPRSGDRQAAKPGGVAEGHARERGPSTPEAPRER
jgi:hypothetical protein